VSDERTAGQGPPPAVREPGLKGTIRTFLELVKFEHSIFALPYAYIGAIYGALYATLGAGEWRSYLQEVIVRPFGVHVASAYSSVPNDWTQVVRVPWLGDERLAVLPTLAALVWVTVAMVGARSFAFVVNRAADKEIDARNPRTAGRAVPAGLVKAWELWLFALIVLAAYLFAAAQLAPICLVLSPIPLAAFLVYPYTKRFTPLCHYWLGLCLGLAAPGGWAAVGAPLADPAPWVFGLAVMLWTAGFDMIYATQDIDCDIRDGVHSMPADYGVAAALTQTRILHVLTVVLLVAGGWLVGAGWPWYLGVAVAAALLWYENSIVKPDDLSRLNAAFFTTNGVIAVILLVGAVADKLVP
jgi:4-hydroxybenzoate polyprenyltransferase